jgi:hypothetical protein
MGCCSSQPVAEQQQQPPRHTAPAWRNAAAEGTPQLQQQQQQQQHPHQELPAVIAALSSEQSAPLCISPVRPQLPAASSSSQPSPVGPPERQQQSRQQSEHAPRPLPVRLDSTSPVRVLPRPIRRADDVAEASARGDERTLRMQLPASPAETASPVQVHSPIQSLLARVIAAQEEQRALLRQLNPHSPLLANSRAEEPSQGGPAVEASQRADRAALASSTMPALHVSSPVPSAGSRALASSSAAAQARPMPLLTDGHAKSHNGSGAKHAAAAHMLGDGDSIMESVEVYHIGQ